MSGNITNITRDEIDLKLTSIGEPNLTDDEWANIRPFYWRDDLLTVLNARGTIGNPLQDWYNEIDKNAQIDPQSEVFIGASLG
ncbi:MAG: hypothetical protein E7011_02075 [Alphaproteobacteria bacterium]|nr:hypothetical protein [Alphaproteobacteria bacterium]